MTIKDKKLIYHLTSLANVSSILDRGLLPRSGVKEFHDIADSEILSARSKLDLENYVPFHWFARNPFDGRVQKDRPQESFILISVHRDLARGRNWKVIPRHPLANEEIQLYDYDKGFDEIDWDVMERRNYKDALGKSVCMAECLSPSAVNTEDFFKIYVSTEDVEKAVQGKIRRRKLELGVTINPNMFC